MEYARNYPCFYGAKGHSKDINPKTNTLTDIIKIGTSNHIAARKSGYFTSWARLPTFEFIIVLKKDSISPQDLYKLDAEFNRFMYSKGYDIYHIRLGGGTELYDLACPTSYLELLKEFLKENHLQIEKIIEDDPYPIRDLTQSENNDIYEETILKKQIHRDHLSLKLKFFQTFLAKGRKPRRIQNELWDIFETITHQLQSNLYKGIVQWPTGTGKTIAMLLLIVLAKEYCVKHGKFYRGIVISPKNDIFETINKIADGETKSTFEKLSEFGIQVINGSKGQLSKKDFPKDKHILVLATHSALIQEGIIAKLPPMNHFHYDEVHYIGGEVMYNSLPAILEAWKTYFLTGTSATPLTSSSKQRDKILALFGDVNQQINIIHQCGVEEAVKEGWIAQPRFHVMIGKKTQEEEAHIREYVDAIMMTVQKKKNYDDLKGGKIIAYYECSIEGTKYAYQYAQENYNHQALFFTAAGEDYERTDSNFCKGKYEDKPLILFSCGRYLVGSDIEGLEMTARYVGKTIAAHGMIQVSGRALRLDYPGKEGWCMIFRPCEEGVNEDDILDSIVLDIIDLMSKSDKKYDKKDIEAFVRTYMGELSIKGHDKSLTESVKRIHDAYMRREFPKRTSKEKYTMIRDLNKEMGLKSKNEYLESASEHSRFIQEPEKYFQGCWSSWYNFLGVDCSRFPQTKADWIRVCKERDIGTWEEYKGTRDDALPENPHELYEDYTNWDKEMGIEEVIVW